MYLTMYTGEEVTAIFQALFATGKDPSYFKMKDLKVIDRSIGGNVTIVTLQKIKVEHTLWSRLKFTAPKEITFLLTLSIHYVEGKPTLDHFFGTYTGPEGILTYEKDEFSLLIENQTVYCR